MVFLYLAHVLVSLTIVFEGTFPSFDTAPKEDNVHHLSLMDMVGKAEVSVKRQLF